MDSRPIATALEKRFPTPSLHLDSPILPKIEAIMPKIMPTISPIYIPRIPRNILNEKSVYYFTKSRSEKFGMSLDEYEKTEQGGDKAWQNAAPYLNEIANLLHENEGPFFMGNTVSYADFVIVGFFQFIKCIGGDAFSRLMQTDASFPALYEASAEWLKRDDH